MTWGHDEREGLLAFCERDREEICLDFFVERFGFAKKHGAVWLEEFLDFYGVMVDDRPLPRGQLGLCDMEKGWILFEHGARGVRRFREGGPSPADVDSGPRVGTPEASCR